ncbi:hypothetical protein BaRGS_00007027 [Batillaria attramentaria]|uniref:Uncharacterized protein n=1 Tax=Batillaria attramentaria TaxID=370345 RepID=A0ABD0LQ48_9CAEN
MESARLGVVGREVERWCSQLRPLAGTRNAPGDRQSGEAAPVAGDPHTETTQADKTLAPLYDRVSALRQQNTLYHVGGVGRYIVVNAPRAIQEDAQSDVFALGAVGDTGVVD